MTLYGNAGRTGSGPIPASGQDALLARELGVRQLAAGIFNYTVGSGIFVIPAFACAQLGAQALLAYVVCAAVMALVVLCFAEAGSRVSLTGGPYAYVEVALGPLVGFVAGVLLFLADLSATSAVTTILASSVASLTGYGESDVLRGSLIVLILAGLASGNLRGVRTGSRMIEVVTVCKLLPLVLFVLAGAFFVQPANLAWSEMPGLWDTVRTAGFLIFAFAGIEGALVPSGEVRAPSRTVPRAIFLALGLATLLYLGIQIVAQGVMGPALAGDKVTPLASAASRFAGPIGGKLMIAAAAVSMFGYLSGAVLAAPRCLFAFGRDGFLPRALASVHPRFRTPYVAIAVYVSLVLLLSITGRFETLAVFANITILSLDLLCAISVWVLRRRDVRMAGEPFRIPGGPIVPALACAAVLWLLWVTVTRRELAAVGVVLVLALAAYAIRARRLRAVSTAA